MSDVEPSEESGEESEGDNSEYDGDELERLEAQLRRRKRAPRRRGEEEDPPRRLQRLRRNREEESGEEESSEGGGDVSWREGYDFIDNASGRLLHDPGWREMYKYFDAGNPEPPGYSDHPDYHIPPQLTADQLWQHIRLKTIQPGFYPKYGVKAERRAINGSQVRTVDSNPARPHTAAHNRTRRTAVRRDRERARNSHR